MINKQLLDKIFSTKRMEKYFASHLDSEERALTHYYCNIAISESLYTSISIYEVALRNSIERELITCFGRENWYTILSTTPGLETLNKHITTAIQQISARGEVFTPSKLIAELTLGFWVSLFNRRYERILWKDLRRAFPYMPKKIRQRQNIASRLNNFRKFRNRIFHHEPICWSLDAVQQYHDEMLDVMGWLNQEIPTLIKPLDRFDTVMKSVRERLDRS